MKEKSKKKAASPVKKIILFSVLFLLGLLAGFTLFRKPLPFTLSADLELTDTFVKVLTVAQKDQYTSTTYTEKTKAFLSAIHQNTLTGLHCSDTFFRTDQGAYVFDNLRVNYRYKKRIKNENFIEFLRSKEPTFTPGKKILTGRVCETEQKDILLFYSIGKYDIGDVGEHTIKRVITNSTENEAYVEFIPQRLFTNPKTVQLATSHDHIRCDHPFAISKDFTLIVLCGEEKKLLTEYTVRQVSLHNGTITTIETCSNAFSDKLQTRCQ